MPVNPHIKGGPDVPVTDGGTGASDAASGLSNLGGLDTLSHAGVDHTGVTGVRLVDWVYADTTSTVICTAAFNQGLDVIPTAANGTLVLTTPAFTPKSTSNFLVIEFFCTGAQNANTQPGLFFVQVGQPGAFWAATGRNASSAGDALTGKIIVPVGVALTNHPSGTAARQYQAYIGVSAGFNYTVNGFNSARLLGGVQRATFSVTELAP